MYAANRLLISFDIKYPTKAKKTAPKIEITAEIAKAAMTKGFEVKSIVPRLGVLPFDLMI
jgi:hypothetical protein